MFPTLSRGLRSAAVVVAVSVSVVAAIATPVHAAAWVFFDNFESNPSAHWWFENGPGSFDASGPPYYVPHSGSAFAAMYRDTVGWTTVDRALHLPTGLTKSCRVEAWFAETVGTDYSIEVINPATWTYVAAVGFTNLDTFIWVQRSLSWVGGPTDVVVRFGMSPHDGALPSPPFGPWISLGVDDVRVVCQTF